MINNYMNFMINFTFKIEQNNILLRMRELAIQASSDTFGDSEREMLDSEFQQITQDFKI